MYDPSAPTVGRSVAAPATLTRAHSDCFQEITCGLRTWVMASVLGRGKSVALKVALLMRTLCKSSADRESANLCMRPLPAHANNNEPYARSRGPKEHAGNAGHRSLRHAKAPAAMTLDAGTQEKGLST